MHGDGTQIETQDQQRSRTGITAYFRTLNESATIERAIAAAARVADEIIVVDSGSTDATRQLAEKAGARVVDQAWLGSGRQKRVAEDIAQNDWLLDLDADEILSEGIIKEIIQEFRQEGTLADIYRTPMAYAPPTGKPWIGFGGVKRHKLYNRKIVRQPDHRAWDQFAIPDGARVKKLKSPILHYAWKDTEHLVQKVNKHSSVRASLLPPKPKAVLALRIVFGLPIYIAKRFFLNGLFRAGISGFAFSVTSGYGRWLKDAKMYERLKKDEDHQA
ncbi:MAG: glycosyltransferase family 2 protein [Pseudomonadota bacterium]